VDVSFWSALLSLNWLTRSGFGPVGVTGISMGGHNAALAGASWNRPCSIVPCLSWTTASKPFTEGVMRESVSWDVLETEFSSYDHSCMTELCQLIHSPEFDANNEIFRAGKQFAKDYPKGIMGEGWDDSHLDSGVSNGNSENKIRRKAEAITFMRGIMDECTHLGNFSRPVDSSLAFVVTASCDGFVPQVGSIPLTNLWKGCIHRNIPAHGHVSAILFKADVFRQAITDSFELNAQKYYGVSLLTSLKEASPREESQSPEEVKSSSP